MSVTKTASAIPIAPEHDQTLDRLTKTLAHLERAAQYLQQLQTQADELERQGLERGKCHWKGKYLSLYYKSDGGKRVERYIGCKAEAIAEVQAGQRRHEEWVATQVAMIGLRKELDRSDEIICELYQLLEWYWEA